MSNWIKDEYGFINGQIDLDVWKGYISSEWFFVPRNAVSKPSDGIIKISICAENEETAEAFDYQIRALDFLLEKQNNIQEILLLALMKEFPLIAKNCDYLDIKDNKLPIITEIEQFKKIIGLTTIHLQNLEKDGYGYVGYQFKCVWDGEHGLGIMTHKDRIIEIGGADSSFAWVNDPER